MSVTSSSASNSSDETTEEDDAVEWLFVENGCAVCETCLAHLSSKKKVHVHHCQREEHRVPTDKSKFERIEFFGATTDKVFNFFMNNQVTIHRWKN